MQAGARTEFINHVETIGDCYSVGGGIVLGGSLHGVARVLEAAQLHLRLQQAVLPSLRRSGPSCPGFARRWIFESASRFPVMLMLNQCGHAGRAGVCRPQRTRTQQMDGVWSSRQTGQTEHTDTHGVLAQSCSFSAITLKSKAAHSKLPELAHCQVLPVS